MADNSDVISQEDLETLLDQIQYGMYHTGLSPWIFLKKC